MEIKKKIISIMRSSFSDQNIDENSTNDNTDSWDSMNFLLLVVNLESKFGIEFQPEEIADLNSFKSIFNSILNKLDKS
tara:strand:- start:3012 stop:3245 length:234 start_codon:yes stop_codon:yes gene_type:complete